MGVKLIRDLMPDIPWRDESAKVGIRRVLSNDEHVALLRQKILEEVGELFGDADVASEAADVIEAVLAYAYVAAGVTFEMVHAEIEAKRWERGGFTEGTAWETPT